MAIDFARETALKILYDINEKGAYSNIALNKHLEAAGLKSVDKAFITELVYGSVKWKLSIDWIIDQFSSVRIKKIAPWILNILRLGVYQLLYTDKVPESAACNESVNLTKKYGHAASSRFVNAVLRNIARNRDKIAYPGREEGDVRYLSVKYSHPEWMVAEWLERFGNDFTTSLLDANNTTPEFIVRANRLRVTPSQLVEALKEEGVAAVAGRYAEEAVIIENPAGITRLEAFKKGYFQVQDESSMLVAKVLDPKPGELVVDVCSAPGGKSTHIAEMMTNRGRVVARDIHPHKIKLIQEAAERLGIDIIKAEVYDASELDASLARKADRVLVDAPCTGLGIIRRKPDIKWARNMGDREEITRLQAGILRAASEYVKPGGVLVYSTCTLQEEENQAVIAGFLKDNNEFQRVDITPLLPSNLMKSTASEGYIQLFPNVDGIDGFFISRLQRKG